MLVDILLTTRENSVISEMIFALEMKNTSMFGIKSINNIEKY